MKRITRRKSSLNHPVSPFSSASVLERAIELFMKYVPGEASHKFELLSDARKNFSCEGAEVPDTLPVWLNGNFEVAKPIMTIHGNHDNPTGEFDNTVIEYLAELGLIRLSFLIKRFLVLLLVSLEEEQSSQIIG